MALDTMRRRAILGLAVACLFVRWANAGSAVAIGSNGRLGTAAGWPVEEAKQRALKICTRNGGLNPRILASTDAVGDGAIAVARQEHGKGWLISVSLGRRTAVEAQTRAIEQCRKAGGSDPKVRWGFRG
jgi:hypothetical protein